MSAFVLTVGRFGATGLSGVDPGAPTGRVEGVFGGGAEGCPGGELPPPPQAVRRQQAVKHKVRRKMLVPICTEGA